MHEADRSSHAWDMYVTYYMPVPGKELGHFRSDIYSLPNTAIGAGAK